MAEAEARNDRGVVGAVELTMGDRLNLITLAVPPAGGLADDAGHVVGATVLSAVLMQLGLHADGHGMAFPSVRKVAARIGAGTRTVDRALAAMEAAGMLERRGRRRGACGTWGPTVWRLRWGRIAGLVPAAERFRLPQGIVVLEGEAHEPRAPGAHGGEGDGEGHHAPLEGATMRPQGAQPCAPRGARTPSEPPMNPQQQQEAAAEPETAAGGGARGGDGAAAAGVRLAGGGQGGERAQDGGGRSGRRGRNGAAVEAMARQLAAWGIGEPNRTILANQCGDGVLPMAEAREVHRRWWDGGGRSGRKGVGALVNDLRDLAGAQAERRRIEREWADMAPGERWAAARGQLVRHVRGVVAKRSSAGLPTDEPMARRLSTQRMAEAAARLGIEGIESECTRLWDEVCDAVARGAGGGRNSESCATEEAAAEEVA